MAVDLLGFDELKNDLLSMAGQLVYGESVDRALEAGAVPIEQQMLQNASTDPKIRSGDLHDSIRTSKVRQRRDGGKYIKIGVRYNEKSAYYANPVEFGHEGPAPAPAHPFVRPAFDTRKDEAYEVMRNVLREELTNKP